jgi:hypothetical protein
MVQGMSAIIAAPLDWVESVGKLRFPAKTDRRLQELDALEVLGKTIE